MYGCETVCEVVLHIFKFRRRRRRHHHHLLLLLPLRYPLIQCGLSCNKAFYTVLRFPICACLLSTLPVFFVCLPTPCPFPYILMFLYSTLVLRRPE